MRKSKLSQYKQERLIELFIAGSTASIADELVGAHRNTAAYYFHRLRVLIVEYVDKYTWFDGEIELDESYFGGRRKGQRGRGVSIPEKSPIHFQRSLSIQLRYFTYFICIKNKAHHNSHLYVQAQRWLLWCYLKFTLTTLSKPPSNSSM